MTKRKLQKPPFRAGAGRIAARAAALAAAALFSLASLWPQQPAPKPDETQKKQDEQFKIGVEVNMITVPVTVRKSGGGFARGLPQSAFRIREEGEDQEILLFAQEGVPARVAIVLDISGSVRSEWGTIKYATRKFTENLHPDDQFALVTFNTETRLKMDWGRQADRLDAVLGSVYCKDMTNLWDALYVVGSEVFAGIREKKAMILMSDGLDNNSSVTYKEAMEAAVRSEAMVYVVSKTQAVRDSIRFDQVQAGIYDGISHEVFVQADLALRKVAYETGGRVLYPNNFGQLGNVYAEVDEELRNQYTLGYISTNPRKDGSYRRIEVFVDAPAVTVSARPGYYAPVDAAIGQPEARVP